MDFTDMSDDELVRHAASHAGASHQGALGELSRRSIMVGRGVRETTTQLVEITARLVQLAELERDARIASERTTRRWQWTAFVIGMLTLLVAAATFIVSL